uniref:Rx_N domain-containing protein n=1 Tax=Gongylonema pulchrum TaxID=637853 RepID=A0A183D0B6_9BILA
LLDVVAKSLLDALVLEATNKYVREIGRCKIDEGINYVKSRLDKINRQLDRLWLKQFFDRWRECTARRKEENRLKMELLGTFPVLLPASCQLVIHQRYDPLTNGCIADDYSKLLFGQKLDAFVEKRREKVVRKAFAKWRTWTRWQIERREFFTVADTNSTLKLHRRSADFREDEVRLRMALAEAECERLKPFLIDEEFLDGWFLQVTDGEMEDNKFYSCHAVT